MNENKVPSSRNMSSKPEKIRGIVNWFSDASGIGFISVKGVAEAYFVSFHDVADKPVMIAGRLRKLLYKDDTVEFYPSTTEVMENGIKVDKPSAKHVRTALKSTEKFQGFSEDFFK